MRRIIFTFIGLVGLTANLHSQEISADDKAKAEKEVKAIIDSRVKAIVTPLVLAEKLNMDFPPQAPTETVASIDARVKKDVMTEVDAKYPPSTKDVHLKVALEKYVLYKEDDEVKDLRIRPVGRKSVISGRYKGINRKGEHVVGSYPIPKTDATEDVLVHFDPELNKKKIEQYIKNKMFYHHDDREKMKKDLTPKLEEKYFTEAGYYKDGDKYVPAAKFLKDYYEKEKVRVAQELKLEVEAQVFAKYNMTADSDAVDTITDISNDNLDVPKTDDFELPDAEPAEEKPSGVRVKIPLFDPSFYDPEF
ncbi:MAG: hypothetical protein NE328_01415 [Lentisphaeraceae bacterium]|nr:hypothetical protein [Lentisphaeraceae bacterium]